MLTHSHKYIMVASSAVKKWFDFPRAERGSQYEFNKRHSIKIATSLSTGDIEFNDHTADCILNAVYVARSKKAMTKIITKHVEHPMTVSVTTLPAIVPRAEILTQVLEDFRRTVIDSGL